MTVPTLEGLGLTQNPSCGNAGLVITFEKDFQIVNLEPQMLCLTPREAGRSKVRRYPLKLIAIIK